MSDFLGEIAFPLLFIMCVMGWAVRKMASSAGGQAVKSAATRGIISSIGRWLR